MVASACGQTVYDFGNPSAEEQHYIELINRARANPPDEGARLATTTDPEVLSALDYFGVDIAMMQSEFNTIPSLPPLAPNANLTTSARGHSTWMLDNATQSHDETNPSNTPHERIIAAGYSPSATSENIFAYSQNSWHGHAGFQVDWGDGGTGGMQDGRGHRMSIHSANFREIGVGIVTGTNGGLGPQVVTQNFGAPSSSAYFATGVAFYDLDNNGFYDVGEGISGLSVSVQGAAASCVTADGGGWTVPIPNTETSRTVTFSGLGIDESTSLPVPSYSNAKADLKLFYTPPAIISSTSAPSGSPHSFTFTPVGGATGYLWKRWNISATPLQNCEDTTNIQSSTTGTYSVLNGTIKQQGNCSFHLENSNATDQSIELSHLYYGGSLPALSFQSRIRISTSSEEFKVQIQEEGTSVWQDVDVQIGGTPENSFSLRSVQFPAMKGKLFRVRFLLHFPSGSYYPYSGDDYGWFIDAITFRQTSLAENLASQLLATTTGSFTPTIGNHLMLVAPVISGIGFPPAYQVFTTSDSPLSSNADLASLSLSAGTLSPFFAATTTSYTIQVNHGVSSLKITPKAAHQAARIAVNSSPLASGTESLSLPLSIGQNDFKIIVTAQNGTACTYSLTVIRAPSSNARLAALKIKGVSLKPNFKPGKKLYQSTVRNSITSVRVLAKTSSREAHLKINGKKVISGKLSKPIKVRANSNTIIHIVVKAGNGSQKTYRIVLKRISVTTTAD